MDSSAKIGVAGGDVDAAFDAKMPLLQGFLSINDSESLESLGETNKLVRIGTAFATRIDEPSNKIFALLVAKIFEV